MQNPSLIKLIGYIKAIFLRGKLYRNRLREDFQPIEDVDFCHKDKVHIIVRGLADGRLHIAKNRNYSDVRFYKKENLKIFCAVCRKRII